MYHIQLGKMNFSLVFSPLYPLLKKSWKNKSAFISIFLVDFGSDLSNLLDKSEQKVRY